MLCAHHMIFHDIEETLMRPRWFATAIKYTVWVIVLSSGKHRL